MRTSLKSDLLERHDAGLANALGNLLSRTLKHGAALFRQAELAMSREQARQREPQELLFIDHPDADSAIRGVQFAIESVSWKGCDPYGAEQIVEVSARECDEVIEKRKPWVGEGPGPVVKSS